MDIELLRIVQSELWTLGELQVDGMSGPLASLELGPTHCLSVGLYSWSRGNHYIHGTNVILVASATLGDGMKDVEAFPMIHPGTDRGDLALGCIAPGMTFIDGADSVSMKDTHEAMGNLLEYAGNSGSINIANDRHMLEARL